MFGMLDYRAHKLFWLIYLPFRLLIRITFFLCVAIGVAIGQWTEYSLPLKILVGYAVFEGAGLCMVLVFNEADLLFRRAFLWAIDVVPARGSDPDEAKQIVLRGPIVWLDKKLNTEVENWTPQDTKEYVRNFNWRLRLVSNIEDRFEKHVAIFKQHYLNTGQRSSDMTATEVQALSSHLELNWLQKAISYQHSFNAILGGALIVASLLYLNYR